MLNVKEQQLSQKEEYKKPYFTIAKQINILKERGLNFHNEDYANSVLKHISYYRLSGYLHHFYTEEKVFDKNIYFEDIIKLYGFDKKLRLLMLDALETIEVSWRTTIIEVLGEM